MQRLDIKKKTESSYDAHHLDILAEAEEGHFWFEIRREKICRTFERYVPKSSRILEIGGGTGFIASKLIELGYCIEMADMHRNALEHAKMKGITALHPCDLFDAPFHEEFDVVCLFDVLEHLSDPFKAMECIRKMLKPGGRVILTVPAHSWLWSREDVIAGHKTRFTKQSLSAIFLASRLEIIDVHYFFSTLLPWLFLRRWIKRDDGSPLRKEELFNPQVHPLLNSLGKLVLRSELFLAPAIPNLAGGSLLGIAHKIP